MLRAIQVAHGGVIGARLPAGGAGGVSNAAVYEAFLPNKLIAWSVVKHIGGAEMRAMDAVKWHQVPAPAWFANTVQYPPTFYVPDAIAYVSARAANMRADATLRLARLLNAAVYAAMSAGAIALAKRTKLALAALLALPMSIAMGASASQDAMLLPVAAMAVALLDRISARSETPDGAALPLASILLACVAMARPPYSFLLVSIPALAGGSRRSWLCAAAAATAVAAWCVLVAVNVMVPIGQSNPAAQWHRLISNPARLWTITLNTVRQAPLYWSEFIGRIAWNDTKLPLWYRLYATVAIVLCAVALPGRGSGRARFVLLGIGLATAAIFVLQYLDWTAPGADVVEGVVGRYFLPLAMTLLLAVPSRRSGTVVPQRFAYAALAGLAIATPPVMIHHILARFYPA